MKVRHERSAGILLFREAVDARRLYLLLDYGKHWDYPKGHVDPGETDIDAAVRELQEETGIVDANPISGFTREMNYFFRSKGALVRKSVVFFLAKTGRKRVKISSEHVGYEFLPFDQALKRLTYPNAREMLRAAEEFLRSSDATPATTR